MVLASKARNMVGQEERKMVKKAFVAALVTAAMLMGGAASGCQQQPPENNQPISVPDENNMLPVKLDPIYASLSAFVVYAQVYRIQGSGAYRHWVGVGGSSSAFINATPNGSPGGVPLLGGVEGSRPGPFPFETTITAIPLKFPIYVPPGVALEIETEFITLIDVGWRFKCWITDRAGHVIAGSEDERLGEETLRSTLVACHTIVIG